MNEFLLSWQLSISVSLAVTTVFALLYRNFAKENPEKVLVSTPIMYVLVLMPLACIVAFSLGGVSFNYSQMTWGFLVVGGCLFAFSNASAFLANSHVDAAQFSILMNFRTLVTLVVAGFFLDDTLTAQQMVGVGLVLVAAFVVISVKLTKETLRVSWYSLVTLLSATSLGLAITVEKYLLEQMSFSSYLIVGWGLQTAIMVVVAIPHFTEVKNAMQSSSLKPLLLLGLLRTCGGLTIVYALKKSGSVSLVASISTYKTALVVAGSYFILKEKDHFFIKLFGTVLATAGLFLL